jgi:hypothetical protein
LWPGWFRPASIGTWLVADAPSFLLLRGRSLLKCALQFQPPAAAIFSAFAARPGAAPSDDGQITRKII